MGTKKKAKAPAAPVQIAYLEVENLGGIAQFAIEDLGPLTVLEGANGAGKSTVLAALTATLLGGSEGRGLLKVGAKSGKLTVGLTNGWTVRGRWNAKGSSVDVTDAEGATVRKPRERLSELVRGIQFAPARFLAATDAERVRMLAALVDDPTAAGDVLDVLQRLGWDTDDTNRMVERAESTFDLVDTARKELRAARQGIGRQQKQAAGTVERLRAVAADSVDVEALRADRGAAQEQWSQLERAQRGQLDKVDAAYRDREAALRQQIAELEKQLGALDAERYREREAVKATAGAVLDAAKARVGELDHAIDEAQRSAGARQEFERAKAEATQLGTHYEQHTAALSELDALTAGLVSKLPGGLLIDDGQLAREIAPNEVVPFDRLSTGERMAAAVAVAQALAGGLGVMCLDGLEALDAEHLAAFGQACADAGLQGIGAKVGEGPLAAVRA